MHGCVQACDTCRVKVQAGAKGTNLGRHSSFLCPTRPLSRVLPAAHRPTPLTLCHPTPSLIPNRPTQRPRAWHNTRVRVASV